MNERVDNWLFVLMGAFVLAIGMYLGGNLLFNGVYVSENFSLILAGSMGLLISSICGSLIINHGLQRSCERKEVNKSEN